VHVAIFVRDDEVDALAEDLVGGIAEDGFGGLVPERETAIGVRMHHGNGAVAAQRFAEIDGG